GLRVVHDYQMAHSRRRGPTGDQSALQHDYLQAAPDAFEGTSGTDNAGPDDYDIEALTHPRMPQQKGSRSSTSNVLSGFTKARPRIRGEILPAASSIHVNDPVKMLPMMLSWTHNAPDASFPSAARHASLALVPVPQGDRS